MNRRWIALACLWAACSVGACRREAPAALGRGAGSAPPGPLAPPTAPATGPAGDAGDVGDAEELDDVDALAQAADAVRILYELGLRLAEVEGCPAIARVLEEDARAEAPALAALRALRPRLTAEQREEADAAFRRHLDELAGPVNERVEPCAGDAAVVRALRVLDLSAAGIDLRR